MSDPLQRVGWSERLDALWSADSRPGLEPGRISAQHKGSFTVITAAGEQRAAAAGALLHRATSAEDLPAVGDWVGLRPGMIEVVLPRSGALVRKVPGERSEVQVLAANVDTTLVVATLTNAVNVRRLERYTTIAWDAGAPPLVVLTKSDLVDDAAAAARAAQSALGTIPVVSISNVTGEGFEVMQAYLEGTPTLAALGPSGVGKSSLINRLLGAETLTTGEVRHDGKGRHTTTHRQLLPLPDGGALIDTPGLREVGLAPSGDGIDSTFEDVTSLAAGCRFPDCTHVHEPGCAVKDAVATERLAAYHKQRREAAALARRMDKRLASEERRRWKLLGQEAKARARIR